MSAAMQGRRFHQTFQELDCVQCRSTYRLLVVTNAITKLTVKPQVSALIDSISIGIDKYWVDHKGRAHLGMVAAT